MTGKEIIEFSKNINMQQLKNYRIAVGRKTRHIIKSLTSADMKRKFEKYRLQQIIDEGAVLFLEDTLKRNNALYITAELNGEIVGSLNFSAGIRPRKVHIGEFGVSALKDYWGNGIATELIKYLIAWADNKGSPN